MRIHNFLCCRGHFSDPVCKKYVSDFNARRVSAVCAMAGERLAFPQQKWEVTTMLRSALAAAVGAAALFATAVPPGSPGPTPFRKGGIVRYTGPDQPKPTAR